MKCDKCGEQTDFRKYLFIKCGNCQATVQDFFQRPDEGWKLRISFSEEKKEIEIVGNKAGLEYLASCALGVANRMGPDSHIHLEPLMYNLSEGSTSTLLQFDEDSEGKIAPAATGKPHQSKHP